MSICLPNVKGAILAKVLDWCEEHKNDTGKEGEKETNDFVIPEWDKTFLEVLQKETLLELTVAANYLDIKGLLNVSCKAISNKLKGKTGEQIRNEWEIVNEFTKKEDEAIKKENEWCE